VRQVRGREANEAAGSAEDPDENPRARTRSGSDTRRKLLDTAEALIAERGLQAVSVRDITGAATANSAAIHYHFQSKEGLVLAVLADRAEALRQRRSAHLDRLGDDVTVRDLALAMVLPTVELTRAGEPSGAATYVGFLATLLDEPGMIEPIEELFGDQYDRYVEALRRACPELPEDVARNRVAFTTHLVLNAASPQPRGIRLWAAAHHPTSQATLADDLVDFLAGALGAPSRVDEGERSRRR
jgi:AcrR family transcriptional regulator